MTYDVLVVGAGPAGSATAAHLAARGHRVLLVDRAHFPRRKPCAEYISPGGAALLQELGVPLRGGRYLRGMRIFAPNATCHLVDYRAATGQPLRGLSIARTELDTALVEVARARGAEVREGLRIAAPIVRDGGVRGVVAASGEELEARMVIGADGLHSVIARGAGGARPRRWPRRLGLVLHLADVPWPEEVGHMYVGRQGYVGVAPLDHHGLVSVGLVGSLGGPSTMDRVRDALREHPTLDRRLSRGTPVGQVQGVGLLARRVRRLSGPGYMLVGDAAGFFDPFTGEGIFRALRGAQLAAAATDAALRGCSPVPYAAARREAFRAKEQLTYIIQVFVQVPALMNVAVARLRQRPRVARQLGNMLGDLEPARLGIVWDLLRP